MMKEYTMGNGAIALGALTAGVNLAAGYPGTPSSEIIETIASHPHDGVHVEWSVNEKAALEVAAAAAYSGARALVTMKQMGLNVASDALMSVAYVGVKGGLVIVSADDPGPISSQTEQDTRRFADFCRIPVFDPASTEEAFVMIQDAFEYSEKYETPVLFRPTTRICHAYAAVDVPGTFNPKDYEGFVKDTKRWVIFPRTSYENHGKMEDRNREIARDFSGYRFNTIEGGTSPKAILTSGISYAYLSELSGDRRKARPGEKERNNGKEWEDVRVIRIATAFPFPEDFMLRALEGVSEVLCLEELSPYLEEQLLKTIGRHHLNIKVSGKLDGKVPHNGENSVERFRPIVEDYLGKKTTEEGGAVFPPQECRLPENRGDLPDVPARPPVLCAGCPHRASFYAVKQAMKGRKAFYCGDIGCYTLGNAQPLDMVDTCLCMGAGITMAQGMDHCHEDGVSFAFAGDSTFFASGMTGVVNALYNQANMILCVLDNSTTAMTGHQPHPGTGRNMMGNIVEKVSIARVLEGMGVRRVLRLNPFDLKTCMEAVRSCAEEEGVKAIIFEAPCAARVRSEGRCEVDGEKCTGCMKCIREIGCPALIAGEKKVAVDRNLCTGCRLCEQICPARAIGGGENA